MQYETFTLTSCRGRSIFQFLISGSNILVLCAGIFREDGFCVPFDLVIKKREDDGKRKMWSVVGSCRKRSKLEAVPSFDGS